MKAILKVCNYILTLTLLVLGFESCSDDEPMRYEYGTPSAKFIINGKITSTETEMPVKGVQVTVSSIPNHYALVDTTYSDINGFYSLENGGLPSDTIRLELRFKDIDGDLNGNFEDKDTVVVSVHPKYTGGDGHWYKGEATKEVDIKLESK